MNELNGQVEWQSSMNFVVFGLIYIALDNKMGTNPLVKIYII